ncbi:MAG: MFS transporter [Pseudomonadota bacterium]
MSRSTSEFKFGWPVVVASAVGIGLGMSPLPFYTIGVFAQSLAAEFGWGIGNIMSSLAVFTAGGVLSSPIVGQLTDRYGPRRVVLISIILFSLSFMSFSLMNGSMVMYLGIWLMLAVFGAGTLPITFTRAVNGWFFEKRGLALGLALLGTGVSGYLIKPYTEFMIDSFGWRGAYVAVGALPILIAWPIAFFLFRDVDDPKVADRAAKMVRETAKPTAKPGGLSLREALSDWRFWLLAYSFVPISFAVGGPIPNMETLLDTKGFGRDDAIQLAQLIGIAVIIGRITGGFLLDHFWAPAVAAIILSVPALAVYMLAQPDMTFMYAAIAIMILGAAAGVEYDLMAYLVSRYFGMAHYAAIYGALYGFFALGAGVGPAVFGASFEANGNYDSILMVCAGLFLAGALPLLLLGKYRDYQNEPETSASAEPAETAPPS